jgi:hypothetical protein
LEMPIFTTAGSCSIVMEAIVLRCRPVIHP